MPTSTALPFFLRRSDGFVVGEEDLTSTEERVEGLLLLRGDRMIVQWRVARTTERVGAEIRTDHEIEPVREVEIPLRALANATVRWRGWRWFVGPQIVLTAADLRGFEEVAGAAGLRLDHPATLAFRIRRGDRPAAQEFASTLNLVLAERALQEAEEYKPLPEPLEEDGATLGPAR